MATLSVTSTTETSIKVKLSGLDSSYTGDRVYYWFIDGRLDGYTESSGSHPSESYTFTGLDSGTKYDIDCEVEWYTANGAGDAQYSSFSTTGTTDEAEAEPYFEILLPTDTTVGVVVSDITVGDIVRVYIRTGSASASTGTVVYDAAFEADDDPFYLEDIGGLSPSTTYTMNVMINGGDWLGAQQFKTGASESGGSDRPDDWAWWSVVAKGAEFRITAAEWNAFTSRINDFRVYTGLSKYSFTEAVSGETLFSADIVNEARTAIAAISGHGTLPAVAVQGEPGAAAFLNDLKDALNAVD